MPTEVVTDRRIYERVIQETVAQAESFVWIATADIKDLHVDRGKRMVPFLSALSDLIDDGVVVRIIHAKEPGPAFRNDFDRFPNLLQGLEMILCPRAHFKTVIVDGKTAYTGSANLTGAGMGAKSENRRNFESGILSDEPETVRPLMAQFDALWMGERCQPCQRKEHCVTYHELLGG
ncbi:MAG: phospholipase D family protein [Opitutales bacterium]|nr:phospholipase D family protein [Opitutales bacterium]